MHLPPIRPVPRTGNMPTSVAQELLLSFIAKAADAASLYNLFRVIDLAGSLNIDALQRALNEMLKRHEILRTTFGYADGRPVQVIAEAQSLATPLINLEHLPADEQTARVNELAIEQIRKPFDLSKDLLLRATILRLEEKKHVLVLTTHHIAADGWSIRILLNELFTLYQAFANGEPSPLPDLPVQYADFAYWQRQWTEGESLEKQLAFWRGYLHDSPSVDLPVGRPRPAIPSFEGAHRSLSLSIALTEALKTFSRRQGVTLYMTLLAAFKALLFLYTGQDDLVVSTPIANRVRKETESLIGFFINNLLLRTSLSSDPTLRELLNRVRRAALDAYDNQEMPLGSIMNAMQMDSPQLMCALVPRFKLESMEFASLSLSLRLLDPAKTMATGVSRRDLTLYMVDFPDGLKGTIEYRKDIFDEADIENLIVNFQRLLESIVADPDRRLSTLALNLKGVVCT